MLWKRRRRSVVWASKLHFYISGVTFYNFPYTFGFLIAAVFLPRLNGKVLISYRYEDFYDSAATAQSALRITRWAANLRDPVLNDIATLGEPWQLESLCPQLVDNGA